jgi:lysophospholipase L1-like esterase
VSFAIKPKQTVLFIGDSITDCGRRDANAPLGSGYVKFCNDLIVAKYPAHQLNVINKGISGNTVRNLRDRWTDDVINLKPDWVSVKIGINDVHRWHMQIKEASVTPDEFAEFYDQILSRTKQETQAQIILIEPFFISTDSARGSERAVIREKLPLYIRTVHAMVKKYQTRHVRTEEIFQELLKRYPADHFCPEPVHPYANGHLVIAHAWLSEMGW